MLSRSAFLWLVLLAAYDFLFWHQASGVNLLLFSMLVMIALYLIYPDHVPAYQLKQKNRKDKITLFLGAGVMVAGISVVLYGSVWNVFATIFALAVFATAVRVPELHSVYFLFLQAVSDFFTFPVTVNQKIIKASSGNNRLKKFFSFLKIALLPILIAVVFLFMYAWGSPHFAAQLDDFLKWMSKLFKNFSFAHFFFLLGGICAISILIWRSGLKDLIAKDAAPEILIRKKTKNAFRFPMNGLRKEMKAGIILLVLLNFLLLFVNVLDIRNVWINFTVPQKFSLKNFVHEGTWVLIACILLSMLVILILFRRNQHFYKENKLLRTLAVVWIVQNIFLALSVFMRNKYYIGFHGLAYGRIGIIAFIALVICGLITLIIKIRKNKSTVFLLRTNALATYILIIGMGLVNWNRIIVNYNLYHPNANEIDVDFYLTVSGSALVDVWEQRKIVEYQIDRHNQNDVVWIKYSNYKRFESELISMIYQYKQQYESDNKRSWPSWNFSDAALMNKHLP